MCHLFVELGLSLLTVLLGALLRGHVLRNGRAGMSLVSSRLGVDALVLLDGLDAELLLALSNGRVLLAGMRRGVKQWVVEGSEEKVETYVLLLLVLGRVHVD